MPTPTRSRLVPAIPAVLAVWVLLVGLFAWRFAGKAGDDVYITYRYVQNLVQGNGFVFNPGERVFGVTDPGTALLIAGVHLVTRLPIPVAGTAATALALLAIAWVLLLDGRDRDRFPEAIAAGTLLLVSPYVWYGQGTGPVFVLALLLAGARALTPDPSPATPPALPGRGAPPPSPVFSPLSRRGGEGGRERGARGVRAGLLAGLLSGWAVACRPDAVVGAGWLGLLLWRDRRRFPWGYALAAALVVAAGCLAAWGWFGTLIPNTLAAKRHLAALDPAARTGARVFWGSALALFRHFGGPLAPVLLVLGLAGLGPFFRSSGLPGRLLVLHAGSLALVYTLLRVPFFIWYTLPAAVACLYGAAHAGGWILRRPSPKPLTLLAPLSRPPSPPPRERGETEAAGGGAPLPGRAGGVAGEGTGVRALRTAAAALLLLTMASWLYGGSLWWREGGGRDWQLAAYSAAGRWLRENTGPRADVAAEEVGILAFTSERPVLDLMGLVSPGSMPYAAAGDMAGAFLARPARFVVFHTFNARGGTRPIVSKPWFPRAYREAARFDFPDLGGSLVLYRRRPGAMLPPPRPPRQSPRLRGGP